MQSQGHARAARILIIDDDDLARETIRLLLEARGYQVVEAGNGKEGIEKERADPVDLVITDVIMSKPCGMEVIRALLEHRPSVRIIAVSGGGQIADTSPLDLAADAGATLTLTKPFTGKQLAEAVHACLTDNPS